ncbi:MULTISPECIES: EamA family transporter [unclassified Knoellia]|uniref:EamA family transporter n=1 Tax=Knoellia altitudinis TaxID=3404795 RepID=UPI00360E245C
MSNRDRLLGLLVALIWGLNFLAVRLALDAFPPFFLAALRYLVVAIPVILFVPLPKAPVRWLVGYGLGFGVLQFGILFLAIDLGMPAGLSSVVLQMGAPMAIALGALFLHERPARLGVVGAVVATLGLCLIGWDRADGDQPFLPFALTLVAALGWALGSLSSRLAQPDSPLRFALWMSVVPPLPLLAVSAVMEGPRAGIDATVAAVRDGAVSPLLALLYIVVFGTVVSAALWSHLLKKHSAAVVAPFAMLVPVVGMAAAWIVLGERSSALSVIGALIVLVGVMVGMVRRTTRPVSPSPRAPEHLGSVR